MKKGVYRKGLAFVVVLLFFGLIFQLNVTAKSNIEIEEYGSEKGQYRVFGFFPRLGRGDLYQYWVFPGISAYLNYWAFEGYAFIFRIKGYSTEQPEYYSYYLPEPVMNSILRALNLI
jgi:hypothetical protein